MIVWTFWAKYFFSLLSIVILFVYLRSKKTNIQTGKNGNGEIDRGSNGPLWLLTGLLVAFALYNLDDINFGRILRPAHATKYRTSQCTRPQEAVPQQEEAEQKTLGTVSIGDNPIVGDFFEILTVDRNDAESLEFTVRYYLKDGTPQVAEFKGNKCEREVSGTWSQVDDSGSWNVVEQGSSKVYSGVHYSHKWGKSIPIKVKLN